MNKKSKVLAGLTGCVLGLSVMSFAFSQWSSDIQINGSVSASGSWDVAVTAASVKTSSSTTFSYNSYDEGTTYINSFAVKKDMKVKISELDESGATIVSSDASKTKRVATVSYYDADGVFHDNELVGYYDTSAEANAANDEFAANVKANGGTVNSRKNSTAWYYVIEYTADSVAADFTDTTVDFANVNFSLPGTWAEYSVTVTNNGTAQANLSDYTFEVSELDDIFVTDVPELTDDVLKAGESCTFTFVVKVSDDAEELNVESQPFTVKLTYNQNVVEDAPAASHTH